MKKQTDLIAAVLGSAFLGIFSGIAFVLALSISTLRLICLAVYEVLVEDWKDRADERKDVVRFPKKPTAREMEESRLRKEQELIRKFKTKL